MAVTSDNSGGVIPYGSDEGAGAIPDGTAEGTRLVGPCRVAVTRDEGGGVIWMVLPRVQGWWAHPCWHHSVTTVVWELLSS